MLAMFAEMSSQLRYRAVRTDELLRTLCGQSTLARSGFISLLGQELEKGSLPQEAWKCAAEECPYLDDGDRSILLRIGERLGATDTEGQLSLLALGTELAGKNLLLAEEESRVKGSMMKKTGLLCGAAAAIMIL